MEYYLLYTYSRQTPCTSPSDDRSEQGRGQIIIQESGFILFPLYHCPRKGNPYIPQIKTYIFKRSSTNYSLAAPVTNTETIFEQATSCIYNNVGITQQCF